MALPTAATPGYTLYRDAANRGWVACQCLAEWLKWYERVLLARGLIKSNIDIWQLTGGATASAGTHSQGGVFDLLYQTTDAHVAVAREMGAPATWRRTTAQGFSRTHTHGVLSECVHNDPAAYQIAAQYAGRDGLGWRGMKGPDTHARPSTYRSWREGIDWAKREVARLTKTPAPTTEEIDMAAADDIKQYIAALIVYGYDSGGKRRQSIAQQLAANAGKLAALTTAVQQIATQSGQPLDMAAIEDAAQRGASEAIATLDATVTLKPAPAKEA